MKAVTLTGFGGPEVLQIGDVAKPQPAPGQVLVRVAATSVNRPDILQRQGKYPPPPGESEILGLDIAGTIDAVGENVTDFAPGERVMALVAGGGYAEFAKAYAAHVIKIPERMSFAEAGCVCETYITAYLNVFLTARLADGEPVLLHGGGGGVNTAALQLCKALRPRSKILVTASPAKLERVAALGADRVIDYRNEDFAEAVLDFTEQRGAGVILDHIGASYLKSNLEALGTDGRLAIIATLGGREATLDLGRLLIKRHTVFGSVLRPRTVAEKGAIIAEFARDVVPLFASGRIAPVIDTVYPIERVAEAHRAMEASRHFGKLVLSLD